MVKHAYDRIVVVTKKTPLEELIERFDSRDQARFYVEHMGADFAEYQAAHDAYHASLAALHDAMPPRTRAQWIDRGFLPTFTFGGNELVVTLGPDGLVVNTAKYLDGQQLLAFNPDRSRIDGVLVPFDVADARCALAASVVGGLPERRVTMAVAALNDGQSILAVNDLFVGQKTHVSARYTLRFKDAEEAQSSSGLIISTGAGSTGWHRSVVAGAVGVAEALIGPRKNGLRRELDRIAEAYRFDAESERLVFHVREPFPSKTSAASIVLGEVDRRNPLRIISQMPQNGVIFSDGVEEDHLAFNSGAIATIGIADRKLRLLLPNEPDRAR